VVIARNFVDGERDTAAAGAGANPALLRRPQGANGTPDWSSRARRHLAATWFIVSIAVLGAGATLLCVGIGYNLADRSDERHDDTRRAALRAATGEFRAVFGTVGEIDPRFVRITAKWYVRGGIYTNVVAEHRQKGWKPQPVVQLPAHAAQTGLL